LKSATKKAPPKKISPGLARVRKEVPPPSKIFRSKKNVQRQRRKAELRQELKANLSRSSS
jgi:hypothetical protein